MLRGKKDTVQERGGSISLRVLALMDLAPSPSRARHQPDSPSRLSRSGTALKGYTPSGKA
uniref:Uncharacterized protein n=1 Tax=Siphoviridae sp. ctj7f2 TaxID=2823593 RepID=A0A8S5L8N6_9CAUD|nr:MAG TPA: hypothetical protein [Siphoviridae sp. ctj7f2]